jgi:hypothetical protein
MFDGHMEETGGHQSKVDGRKMGEIYCKENVLGRFEQEICEKRHE